MKRIIFTIWNKVILDGVNYDVGSNPKLTVNKFLSIMHRNIESSDYGVVYEPHKHSFIITYGGVEYRAVFPTKVQANLKMGKDNVLTSQLKKLAAHDKEYNEWATKDKEYRNKIKEIESSGYDNLVKIEDYELYLDYLNNKSKRTKSKEAKDLIDTKIRGILKVITNPYNLKLHFNRLICEIAQKGEFLSDEKKKELEVILSEITDDYYSEIVSKQNETLILGSSDKPMSIIRRIADAEYLVQEWLKNSQDKNIVEARPIQRAEVDEKDDLDLDEISTGLREMIGGRSR